ncbi:beta family protein [Streptomyces clavifer]|uniref:beta family protein n=1 Tax=Streptomyces clavifer TaxID=68188 RepID=UPI00352CA6D9
MCRRPQACSRSTAATRRATASRSQHEEPRTDSQMWQEVRTSCRAYNPALVFGDYGIQPAAALAQLPASGGPSWGVLRSTAKVRSVQGLGRRA